MAYHTIAPGPFDTSNGAPSPIPNAPFGPGGGPFDSSNHMPPAMCGPSASSVASLGVPPTAGSMSSGIAPGSYGAPPATGGAGMPPGSQQQPKLGQNLTLVVSRLLDMPIEETVLGGMKNYRVIVYDDQDNEVGRSGQINGLPAKEARRREMETLAVPKERGALRITAQSPLIFIEVEHVGGFLGGRIIGRCQIHRMDPRSSQVWPYALSDRHGHPANCGIELKVMEEGGPPLPSGPSSATSLAAGGSRPSFPPPGPASMGSTGGLGKPPHSPGAGVASDIHHGVSALVSFEKVADIPHPRNEFLQEVLLSVLNAETEKEIQRIGPFLAVDQADASAAGSARGGGKRHTLRLAKADCLGAVVYAQAPLHFGGAANEGAMYFKIAASYGNTSHSPPLTELIGVTDPFQVSWVPSATQYFPLKGRDGNTLGGIYLRSRLLTEAEATAQAQGAPLGVAAPPGRRVPAVGAAAEPLHRVSGRTGNFPPGSQEEAYEQAAINAEAQNRALLQRCKIADPNGHENNPHVKVVNGYREWDSLDSLFLTLGPNPLAMSEEVGPTVARSYQEHHSALKELIGKLPPARSPADEQLNLELIRTLYQEDPSKVISALRPIICKDPEEIADGKDMSWCPDPPIYAPIRNMHEEDKETLRLACFAPEQDARLCFADVNPNYRVSEDIWGIVADYKTARSRMVPKPGKQRRVKDDCIMA